METKFTRGPWKARGREVEAVAPGIGAICSVGRSHDREQDFADAHLIASAPDLEEAVRNLLGLFDNAVYRRKLAGDGLYEGAIKQARSALAKSRGEQL